MSSKPFYERAICRRRYIAKLGNWMDEGMVASMHVLRLMQARTIGRQVRLGSIKARGWKGSSSACQGSFKAG